MNTQRTARNGVALAGVASLALLGLATAGCERDAGDNLEEAGENIEEAADDAADAVEEAVDDAGDAIDDATDGG